MENLKNYEFIGKMDEEIGKLFYQFMSNLDECIYHQLDAHYPDYKKFMKEKNEMENAFSEGKYDDAAYNAITNLIEDPVKTTHFLLGMKLGLIIG